MRVIEHVWRESGPSTFTHVGRNDGAVNWGLSYRQERGFPPAQLIVLLGCGAVEPFTIAALPRARTARVVAVEIDPGLLELAEQIKAGASLPWNRVAQISKNPRIPNRDLNDRVKVETGLRVLGALGSLDNLGPGFDEVQMRVARSVADRVEFVGEDALSAIRRISNADIIGDFFLQVNVNKSLTLDGPAYTMQLAESASRALASHGLYLIGDTGANLPTTLGHLAQLSETRLNLSSLAHAAQVLGGYFVSSSYLVVSKLEDIDGDGLIELARKNIASEAAARHVRLAEETVTVRELASIVRDRLNFAFVSSGAGGLAWNSVGQTAETLRRLAPVLHAQYSPTIIIPAQKPETGESRLGDATANRPQASTAPRSE
jgi:hypothetical protein